MKQLIPALLIFALVGANGQDIKYSIDTYAGSYANTGDFSGCVLVTKGDEILYENYFGLANHSFNVPNSRETKFKIGSISKQFTAAAILVLEQQNLLHSADTLSKFFPGRPVAEKITIENLLTHTSGITDIYNLKAFNTFSCQNKSIKDISNMLLEAGLDFEPGTRYQYSNGGYALLASIIEQVSGTSYQEFLNKNVFKPLNMNGTGHAMGNETVSNLATGYDPTGYSEVKKTSYLDPELLKGSGSLYSTIHDMNIWINSVKNRSLLDEESYEKLLRNYGHNYGFGISVYNSFGQSVFGHDGRVNGYIADYLHYEESDISVIVMGNIQTGVADFFRSDIAAIVFNEEYSSSAKTIPPAREGLQNTRILVGTYAFGPGFNVYVDDIDGIIQARANEGSYSELIPLEDGRFFSRTLYSYIEFVPDGNGSISKMLWTNNDGNVFEGMKD